jgi:hypothetical protein
VAGRLGLSRSVVSEVLSGSYRSDTRRIEGVVRGALLAERVDCPVLAEIGRDECARSQADRSPPRDPVRRALRAACPSCSHAWAAPAQADQEDET